MCETDTAPRGSQLHGHTTVELRVRPWTSHDGDESGGGGQGLGGGRASHLTGGGGRGGGGVCVKRVKTAEGCADYHRYDVPVSFVLGQLHVHGAQRAVGLTQGVGTRHHVHPPHHQTEQSRQIAVGIRTLGGDCGYNVGSGGGGGE